MPEACIGILYQVFFINKIVTSVDFLAELSNFEFFLMGYLLMGSLEQLGLQHLIPDAAIQTADAVGTKYIIKFSVFKECCHFDCCCGTQ